MTRALVLDDEQDYRKLLTHALENMGLEVSAVASGEDASRRLLKRDVDLLVADIRLKGDCDGLTVAEEAKSSCRDLAVIIITGYGSPESAQRSAELDAIAYLEKPFTLRALKNCVSLYLDRRRLLGELHRLEQELAKAQDESWHARAITGWPVACITNAGEVLFATPEAESILEEVSAPDAAHPIQHLEASLVFQLGGSVSELDRFGTHVLYRRDGVLGHYTTLVRPIEGDPRNGATLLFLEGDFPDSSFMSDAWTHVLDDAMPRY